MMRKILAEGNSSPQRCEGTRQTAFVHFAPFVVIGFNVPLCASPDQRVLLLVVQNIADL